MQLTNFTDYGLRALMRLAGDPERLFTAAEIAREFRLSQAHLVKIIQRLPKIPRMDDLALADGQWTKIGRTTAYGATSCKTR